VAILLEAPKHRPGGPDGQGWNRLSLNAHMGAASDQCAIRPRSYATLHEAWRTTVARWGSFGRCDNGSNCGTCPRIEALEHDPKWLPADTDRVLVRLKEREGDFGWTGTPAPTPYVVDDPEAGWASPRYRWTWENLVRLRGWNLGPQHRDEHGDGFWLIKVDPAQLYGIERTND
jgi:hypothetical protein